MVTNVFILIFINILKLYLKTPIRNNMNKLITSFDQTDFWVTGKSQNKHVLLIANYIIACFSTVCKIYFYFYRWPSICFWQQQIYSKLFWKLWLIPRSQCMSTDIDLWRRLWLNIEIDIDLRKGLQFETGL